MKMGGELLKKEKQFLEQICQNIRGSGMNFDTIVGISSGGLLPTRIIANNLSIRSVDVIAVQSYQQDNEPGELKLLIKKNMDHLKNKSILVVDDLVDYGRTMQFVVDTIKKHHPKLTKTAVIYKKSHSLFQPDFYGLETPKDEWINFSWDA